MGTTRTMLGALLGAALMALVGCGASGKSPTTADGQGDATPTATEGATSPDVSPSEPAAEPGGDATSNPSGKDAPEISRSAGAKGGVVVFWPRVVPRTDDAATRELAGKVQARLAAVVAKAVPKGQRDVRPEPERVCPKSGCDAMTVGVLLTSSGGGCAAVALVSGSGQAAAKLVPWGGDVELKSAEVPFREPPESSIVIKDMVRCEKLLEQLDKKEADVVKAITDAAAAAGS